MKKIWLQDNTWIEIDDYLKSNEIIVLPIGSTEQHGPAAAVGLDAYVAIYLAEDLAKKQNLLVAPPLWYGDSAHHDGFVGTISVTSIHFINYIKDILRNLVRQGFRKIVIINGNKVANLPAIQIAAKEVHEYDYKNSIISIADPVKIARGVAGKLKGGTIEHHAGLLEVSQLMYKNPSLVDAKLLKSRKINHSQVFSEWGQYDLFGSSNNTRNDSIEIVWNSEEEAAITPSGQFSDNSKASKETGRIYHEYMVEILSDYVDWLLEYKGPIGGVKNVSTQTHDNDELIKSEG